MSTNPITHALETGKQKNEKKQEKLRNPMQYGVFLNKFTTQHIAIGISIDHVFYLLAN